MMAYLFTNLGAFAVVLVVERREGQGVMIDDYKGLARRNPLLALVFAYFMLSLTGIPPSGGFTAKFSVFGAAIDAGMVWLVIVGVLTSIVSAYFYLRPVFYAFMYDGEGEVSVRPATTIALAITAAATIILGIYPGPVLELAREAVFSSTQLLAGG
jgi:NADH-quinone oxidoreductase subunit N